MKKIFSLFHSSPHRCVSSHLSGLISQDEEPREKDLKEFFKAASKGDLTRLKRLDIRTDIAQLSKHNSDGFHAACAGGHAEVVEFLLERKAQVNVYDDRKRSALMKAVQGQHRQCVKVLLEHGAEPDKPDVGGNTALHCAARIPPVSIAVLLLKHKADVNIRNKKGFTPLTLAVRSNHIKMVELLLQHHANVNITDQDLKSPLMIAASKGQTHLLQLLMHFNADVTLKDIKGWSAHDYAAKNGFFRCLTLLSKQEEGRMNQCENEPQLKKLPDRIPMKKEEVLRQHNGFEPGDASQSETEECWNSSENEETSENTHLPGSEHRTSNNMVNIDDLNRYAEGEGLSSTKDQDEDGRNTLVEIVEFSDWNSPSVGIKQEEKVAHNVSIDKTPDGQRTDSAEGSDAELSDWDSPSRSSVDDEDELTGTKADKTLRVLHKHENEDDQRRDIDPLEASTVNDNVEDKVRKSVTVSRNMSRQEQRPKKSMSESAGTHLSPHQKNQEGPTAAETLELEQLKEDNKESLRVQVDALMFQLADLKSHLDIDRHNRESLETQLVSTCTRLVAAVEGAERCLAAGAGAEKEEHRPLRKSLVRAGTAECEGRVKMLEKKNEDLTNAAVVLQARIMKLEEDKTETEAKLKHLVDLLPNHLMKVCEGHDEKNQQVMEFILKEKNNRRSGINLTKKNCFMTDNQQRFKSMQHLDHEETGEKLDDNFKTLPTGGAAIEVNRSYCKDLEEEMTFLLDLMDQANSVLGGYEDPGLQTLGHTHCLNIPVGRDVEKSRTIEELEEAVEKLTRKKSRLSKEGQGEDKRQEKKKKKKVQDLERNTDLHREVKKRCDVWKVEDEDGIFLRNNRSVYLKHLLTECSCREMTEEVEQLTQKKMERTVSPCGQLKNEKLKNQLDTLRSFCCDK